MTLLTLSEAAERLRSKPRRLREFLRAHPTGLDGRMLYLKEGRKVLFSERDIDRIVERMRHLTEEGLYHSKSAGRVPRRRRAALSGGHTSGSVLERALEMARAKSKN